MNSKNQDPLILWEFHFFIRESMMKNLLILLVLSSCANLKHATNTNMKNVGLFHRSPEYAKKIETSVSIKKDSEVSNCKKLGQYLGIDNVLETGENFAKLYLLKAVRDAGGDSVVILNHYKVGDYGYKYEGIGLKCGK